MSQANARAESPLRVAVVGCGPIGQLHAQAIASSPHATLVAVCDPDADRRQATAARFGAAPYADVAKLLADERPAAVTVATPDHLHVEPTLAALAAGCHVFCEKPLAATLGEANQMVASAQQHGRHLAVDYNRRFGFGYRTARRLCDEGAIGTLDSCLIRVSDATPPPRVARHPHVIFTTLLTHHFDLARHFCGQVCRLHVHAAAGASGELLRSVTLQLEFASGQSATIVARYRDAQRRTAEWMELSGAAGSIVVEDVTRRVLLSRLDPDVVETFTPNPFHGGDAFYDSLIEHVRVFVEAIAQGRQPPVTGADGLAGLQLAAAASQSLVQGKSIEVSA